MQHQLPRRRVSGMIIPLIQSYGAGNNGSNAKSTRSSRRIGAGLPSLALHSSNPTVALVVFRIVAISTIILCIVWFYFVIQIASSISQNEVQPIPLLRRPHVDNPNDGSRIGWTIRQKINQFQLHLQKPEPLLDVARMDSPILIITFERHEYLERALWKIFEHHPAQPGNHRDGIKSRYNQRKLRIVGTPIIISQDGDNAAVKSVIETYRQLFEMKLGVPLYRIEHTRPTYEHDAFDTWEWEKPYKLLAAHYGWALKQVFSGAAYDFNEHQHNRRITKPPTPQRVIILEEDIEIGRDFFSLMNATADLLDRDDTLLAVSAFNDNGKEPLVADPKRLVRSDFFPGLGWMMSRHVWEGSAHHPNAGLKVSWAPNGFWDDWIRESSVRRGRHVLRPEISRTFHFGNVQGTSQGDTIMKLNKIQLDEVNVRWEERDLTYLDASVYAENYWNRVSRAKLIMTDEEARNYVARGDVRMVYSNFEQFKHLASKFDIMQDEKAGVPRTAYEGIVEIRYGRGNFFIFLTPPYVNEGLKPADFGKKPWVNYSKEMLLRKLGIADVPTKDYLTSFQF